METKEVKASLADAFNKIEDVKKSIADSGVVKNETALEGTKDEAEKSVGVDEAKKSDKVEEKSAKDVKISDDNEKATKKADEAKKCDDDEVDESAHRSKKEQEAQDEATKSADEAKKPVKESKEVAKPKEIDKIDDKEGHENASKSADVDLMAKSLDAMVEMHKAYQSMAEATIKSLKSENDTLRKSIASANVEKSVKKDVDDPDADDADGKSAKSAKAKKCDAEKCDAGNTDNTDKDDQQASKSIDEAKKDKKPEDADEAEKTKKSDEADEAEKSVEKSDDEVAKSMPEGKAVSAEAPEANDEAEKSLKMSDFKGVLVKSISAFANTQDSENLHRKNLLKSLYADVRDVADDEAVSDKLITRYNNI